LPNIADLAHADGQILLPADPGLTVMTTPGRKRPEQIAGIPLRGGIEREPALIAARICASAFACACVASACT
jgi:hypothetical protein